MPFEIPAPPPGDPTWPYELYKLLKGAGISQFSYVPDAGHKVLINLRRKLTDAGVDIRFRTCLDGLQVMNGRVVAARRAI